MSFIDKATTFITGKNSTEREADRATAKIIREKQNAIIRQERVKQAEILARERVRAQTESQIKKIKQSYQPRQQNSSQYLNQFGSVFGAPMNYNKKINKPKKIITEDTYIKKGGKFYKVIAEKTKRKKAYKKERQNTGSFSIWGSSSGKQTDYNPFR